MAAILYAKSIGTSLLYVFGDEHTVHIAGTPQEAISLAGRQILDGVVIGGTEMLRDGADLGAFAMLLHRNDELMELMQGASPGQRKIYEQNLAEIKKAYELMVDPNGGNKVYQHLLGVNFSKPILFIGAISEEHLQTEPSIDFLQREESAIREWIGQLR